MSRLTWTINLAVVLVIAAAFDSSVVGAPDRLPIPAQAEQTKALSIVRESFKSDYALPSWKRGDLGRKLLTEASSPGSANDATLRFVLLSEAKEAAVAAGDLDLLTAVLDSLTADYAIERKDLESAIVTSARTARSNISADVATPIAWRLTELALHEDDFKSADRWAAAAKELADKSHDSSLMLASKTRQLDVRSRATEFGAVKSANETLSKNPADPAANLVVGRWLCFQKAEWEKGVAFLARGSDQQLASVAKLELSHPAAGDSAALADAWWDLSQQKNTLARQKPIFMTRAAHWYQVALPWLTGIRAKLAEQRMAEAGAASPGPVAPPVVYLDDLNEKSFSGIHPGGWGIGKHGALQSTGKQLVSVKGTPFKHALGMNPMDHATATVTYAIDRRFSKFTGAVALNDTGGAFDGSLIFRIVGDGRVLWESDAYSAAKIGTSISFSATVRQVSQLQLITECKGSGNGCNVVWLDPKLTPASAP